MEKDKTVYFVHCVDTEGPLYESLRATFERLHGIFGVRMAPSQENLHALQEKRIDLGEKTELVAEVFSSHVLSYNDTWDKIDAMLDRVLREDFRNRLLDSAGNGWVFNWFCLDHVEFDSNPRRRDMGYHNIHDHYAEKLAEYECNRDGLHFHFHPVSIYREAHKCGTSYVNSPHLYQAICRRIIERSFFPAAYRAGFHTIRPDSNWFLEQWIPFDFSNWAYKGGSVNDQQMDLAGGRYGDWRKAPDDWSVYHPSHDDWQVPGGCRRWIARCIDILSRGRNLTEIEVEKAFARASQGLPTLISFCSHDFRDIGHEVDYVRKLIAKVQPRYPEVKLRFCEALEAFRCVAGLNGAFDGGVELELVLEGDNIRRVLKVETIRGKVFGPQPFLAVQTRSGRFIHENFDFDPSGVRWSYTFDDDSIHADDIEAIGVAANDAHGNTCVKVIRGRDGLWV